MFGYYDIPLDMSKDGIAMSFKKEGEGFHYLRECLGEKVEKTVLINNGKVLLNPVEPVNKPKMLTPYLLIQFQRAIVIGPKETKRVFLTFPIEIGAYIHANEDLQLLDIFTFTPPKFTLYGDPRNGHICKYWKSDIHSSIPVVDRLLEGVMDLSITNSNSEWVEVTRTVFNAYGMKIFFSDTLVSMNADMKVKGGNIAETDFQDMPIENGMKSSSEIFTSKKLAVTSPKFVMEFGI